MFPAGISSTAFPGALQQRKSPPTIALPQNNSKKAKERRASRIRVPHFTFTSPADSSREQSPGGSGTEQPKMLTVGGPRRQLSEFSLLRSSVSFQKAQMDEARRRHSGQDGAATEQQKQQQQQRVAQFGILGTDKRHNERVERLPLRAFKKIGRVGTLPALAHTSAASAAIQSMMSSGDEATTPALTSGGGASSTRTAGGGSAFQRWGGNRRGSHLVGWDSARPQSAARQQQQMLERMYSKSELHEYQQLFKMFDTDGSGAIGCEELKGAMLSIGLQADDAEIERLIKEVDEDGNGEIDFPEFCQCMKRSQQSGGIKGRLSNEEVARQCFEVFDQDSNGLITENEFIYVAKEVGGFSQELAEFVFRELLGDSATGQLDQSRFSAIVDDYLFSDLASGGGNDGTQQEMKIDGAGQLAALSPAGRIFANVAVAVTPQGQILGRKGQLSSG
ncbi:hypothetical protein niasHT_038067 [Heterodera trifolii]|uniref:EF-hand domain-containing protein n=1 Tax=Heterodera trifolii TaxID=157864 RepID=A0ABD2HNI7_9BILA